MAVHVTPICVKNILIYKKFYMRKYSNSDIQLKVNKSGGK